MSTLETEESYSMVLEPEAQFLPKFTKEKKDRRVSDSDCDFRYPRISLGPDKRFLFGCHSFLLDEYLVYQIFFTQQLLFTGLWSKTFFWKIVTA